jgi:RNA polymerase sigma-70 factor, ECF subfamily
MLRAVGSRTDEELMAAYVAGQTSAFRELFERHATPLLRLMGQGLFRPEEARDLVQQAFLQLHRSRYDYQLDARFRPWLYTIAINLKREYLRRVKRRPEAGLEAVGGEGPSEEGRDALRFEAAQTLARALSQLPNDQRDVIVLHWMQGLSFAEVAEIVGASVGAVKVRAHRGYTALRGILSDGSGSSP